jgi:molecular chaperone GrpE
MSDPTQADIQAPSEAATEPNKNAKGEAAQAPDTATAELEKLLAEAQAKIAEHHDAFMRAKAESENIRRRAAEDVAKAHKFGVERMAEALLAVKDSLDAALAVENTSIESFKTGVELTGRQLSSVFEKFHVQEINPVGEKFDPNRHQAIAAVDAAQEPNTVVNVMQKGFVLHDRVLRPAMVTVAKAPEGGQSA